MPSCLYYASDHHALTTDIVALRLSPVEHPLSFIAGQYVILEINALRFACSIATPPQTSGQITIHIRHTPSTLGAEVLALLTDTGTYCRLEGPYGTFLPYPHKRLLLLAGGTGIAPFLSLLSVQTQYAHIHLFWGAKTPDDLYALEALEPFRARGLSCTPVISHDTTHWQGATGWVHEAACAQIIDKPNDWQVFASGPWDMVEKAYQMMTAAGLPPIQFYSDMRSSV